MSLMRAVQFSSFGGPEVLEVAQVALPVTGPGEVLVRVQAAAINAHDLANRSGAMRVITGKKFPFGSGLEFAGEIVSNAAEGFQPGTRLWGSVAAMKPHATGAIAELVAVAADRVSVAPGGISAADAASLVVSTTTAIRAIRQLDKVGSGQRVLIRGAAGGVGISALQVAVAAGAIVTTLSSARDFELLRRLGATNTLDYRSAVVGEMGPFDLIFDTVGTQLLAYRRRLARGGRMITIVFSSLSAIASIAFSTVWGTRRIRTFSSDAKAPLLDDARTLIEKGKVSAVIAATYSMSDISQAHRDQEAGGVAGKRVVTI